MPRPASSTNQREPAQRRSWLGPLAVAVLLTLLPALVSLLAGDGAWLAHHASEIPIRMWGLELYPEIGILGGLIDTVGHPFPGLLANPDPLSTAVYALLRTALVPAPAYDLLVLGALAANAAAAFFLARDQVRDDLAAVTAAVGLGTAPIVLSYAVSSAITDLLHLWPFILAILFSLRALRRPGWTNAVLAGLLASLGAVASTYNFVVLSAALFPLVVGLPWARSERWTPEPDPRATATRWQWLRTAAFMLLVLLPLVGGYYLWVEATLADPSSHLAPETVFDVRHQYPFTDLFPVTEGYVSVLIDYLGLSTPLLFLRGDASRYVVVVTPGLAVLALAILGLVARWNRKRTVLLWLSVAAFAALASTGPYGALGETTHLPWPANPTWLLAFYALPGGRMVLEPFRYAFLVPIALVVPVACGAHALVRRLGPWMGWLLPVLVVAQATLLSPLPFPLPTARLEVSPAYALLDEVLGPGALVELPYWDGGSRRFTRMHFMNQRVHQRSIMDDVAGFLPRYLDQNPLIATAVWSEGPRDGQENQPRWPTQPGVEALARDGFAGIVIDPAGYRSPRELEQTLCVLAVLGEPVRLEDRLVIPVPGVTHPVDGSQPSRPDASRDPADTSGRSSTRAP